MFILLITPLTWIDALPEIAELPEQERLYKLVPEFITTSSLPEVVFIPDQSTDAEQVSAFVDDQVKVIVVPTSASRLLDERFTDIVWIGSGSEAEPPPPPHAVTRRRH